MKILMISADPKIFEQGSEVVKRIDAYRALVDDLRVCVVARPWNVLGFLRGYRDGARVLKTWRGKEAVITSQDPAERWAIAWLLAWRFHTPLELQIHTDVFSPFFWRESLKNKIRVLLATLFLPRATTIRVVSERIKQSLIRKWNLLEAPVVVLPISVVVARNEAAKQSRHIIDNAAGLFRSARNDGVFTFLIISRFTKEKNIPLALRAFTSVNKEYSHARLIVVGSGPEEQKFTLQNNVDFVSWQDDLEPYWRQADCYLLTSNYEGYGRTVVEALSHGVPVVMTDVGAAGDLVRNQKNGFVVPVGDEAALVEAMQKAINNRLRFSPPTLLSREAYLERIEKNWKYALARFHLPRLVYILPEYHPDIGTHFYYLNGFIKKISERTQLHVIEEKRERFCLLLKLLWLRLRGFLNFYVHYSFYGALACIIVTKLFGGRVFYWNCGMPWLYEKERGWFEEQLFRFILRNTILVTGTSGVAKQYRDHYGLCEDRMRVMPNWIDLSMYRNLPSRQEARNQLRISHEKKIILFVHRLSKRKGAHRIAAIADLIRDIPDLLVLVVGSGPEEQIQNSKVKSQKLENIVRFEGSVPARRIPLYMAAADVFFMPSDEEGFPHVLLEAMATGTPLVASNVGGVAEIIPQEAKQYLCRPDDIACFAAHIRYFLSEKKELRGVLPTMLRNFVLRYDTALIAEYFADVIARRNEK